MGHFEVAEILVKAGIRVNQENRVAIERHLARAIRHFESGDNSENATQEDGWETEEEEEISVSSSSEEEDIIEGETEPEQTRNSPHLDTRRRSLWSDRQVALLYRLAETVTRPLPLKRLCRSLFRQRLGMVSVDQVRQLPVPRVLKEFLLCRDW